MAVMSIDSAIAISGLEPNRIKFSLRKNDYETARGEVGRCYIGWYRKGWQPVEIRLNNADDKGEYTVKSSSCN